MTTPPIDVVLIGGGIMSATLATFIQELEPSWSIRIYESRGTVAEESSNPWNNAGTGHSALCELNYMPEADDGSVDAAKAVAINEQFQLSRQFWASLVASGRLPEPHRFINPTPHMTFVRGRKNVAYLRKRYAALKDEPLFEGIEFSDDPETIAEWVPLMMAKRSPKVKVAATRARAGTDVDFGALTRFLMEAAIDRGAELKLNHRVRSIRRMKDGLWRVRSMYELGQYRQEVTARFVFVGAGGGALHLLQKSGIPEIKGYGGFPISGKFLRTTNPKLVAQHQAKVYGKAAVGAPPMSVPHLDTRIVNGEASLMFGPYAGFSPKYLKRGSWFDLITSMRPSNILVMLAVARDNVPLLKYLIGELLAGPAKKVAALRHFMPTAKASDWELITAGQRVQIMRKDADRGGVLQMGTGVVASADGSIAGLLGASPGASTAVPIMLGLLKDCFPDRYEGWLPALRKLIPTVGTTLNGSRARAAKTMAATAKALGLPEPVASGIAEALPATTDAAELAAAK